MVTKGLQYDCVLFDWDGCLAQTLGMWLSAFERTYASFGLHPGRQAIADSFGDWKSPMQFGVPEHEYEAFNQHAVELVEVELPGVALYPGVRDVLHALRAEGVPVAMVTSSTRDMIERSVQNHGIAELFDVIVSVDDVTYHKPHAEPVEKALSQLGMTTEESVLVGDSTKDLGAARNAGIASILVYPPEHNVFYELEALLAYEPTHVCRSFDDVRDVLLPQS